MIRNNDGVREKTSRSITTVTGYLGRIPCVMGQVYRNVPVADRSFRFAKAPQSGCNHLLQSQTIVIEQILHVVVVYFFICFRIRPIWKDYDIFGFFLSIRFPSSFQLHYFSPLVLRRDAENPDNSITSSLSFASRRVKVLSYYHRSPPPRCFLPSRYVLETPSVLPTPSVRLSVRRRSHGEHIGTPSAVHRPYSTWHAEHRRPGKPFIFTLTLLFVCVFFLLCVYYRPSMGNGNG